MNFTDNIDEIIKNLSQSEYTFGNGELTTSEIRQIKEAIGDNVLKVIIETCLLTDKEKML